MQRQRLMALARRLLRLRVIAIAAVVAVALIGTTTGMARPQTTAGGTFSLHGRTICTRGPSLNITNRTDVLVVIPGGFRIVPIHLSGKASPPPGSPFTASGKIGYDHAYLVSHISFGKPLQAMTIQLPRYAMGYRGSADFAYATFSISGCEVAIGNSNARSMANDPVMKIETLSMKRMMHQGVMWIATKVAR